MIGANYYTHHGLDEGTNSRRQKNRQKTLQRDQLVHD